MLEKIYTIPINEAFDACAEDHTQGCPFCRLHRKLEGEQLDLILGASMMEPDIRIKTNELGFCGTHFKGMLERRNRLGMGLILESHLNQISSELAHGGISAMLKGAPSHTSERLDKLDKSCYICQRIDYSIERMLENAALLWATEKEFRDKTEAQPYFCLKHLGMWLKAARDEIPKKQYRDFYDSVSGVTNKYFDTLREDVSWFCKKFDYRYDNEPWGNAKDAIERSVQFLCGDMHGDTDKKPEA